VTLIEVHGSLTKHLEKRLTGEVGRLIVRVRIIGCETSGRKKLVGNLRVDTSKRK